MEDDFQLRDGIAEVGVSPRRGAGMSAYGVRLGDRCEPLFRPLRDPASQNPFDLALNLLVPWSNRISGGGFSHRGRFHPLAPNLAGEPYPIHGNGFSSPWRVETRRDNEASLVLESEGPGPFRYNARVVYRLEGGALEVSLSCESRAAAPLPYGLGLHPWLPRSPATLLKAASKAVILEDRRRLPAGERPIAEMTDWDFRTARPLPQDWINNAFVGWDGVAEISWPERGVGVEITATSRLGTFLLYSPGAKADFFCFEPVSHPVDAHNVGGDGLVELAPGDSLVIGCRFTPKI